MADQQNNDGRIHETTTEARAGSAPASMRWVVMGGIVLVVVVFLLVVLVGRP